MTLIFLYDFFHSLNESGLRYCVLRGYECLPEKINNDIDFGIDHLYKYQFFDILEKTAKRHGYSIEVDLIRHSVIKMNLTNRFGNTIKIDVWWQFNYMGLEYLSINKLLDSVRLYKTIFFVPSLEYEFALSYLKELLHNSWIRKDKLEVLTLKMREGTQGPFEQYFNKNITDDFFTSVKNKQYKLKLLSFRAKFSILLKNITHKGIGSVLRNMHNFLRIRFLCRNEYYNTINELVKQNE